MVDSDGKAAKKRSLRKRLRVLVRELRAIRDLRGLRLEVGSLADAVLARRSVGL